MKVFWSILLLVSFFPQGVEAALFSNEVLADQPVGYYRLNEISGEVAYDLSGFQNHGEYGGVVLPVMGNDGLASDNDGSVRLGGQSGHKMHVKMPPLLNPAETGFTLEALVQVDALGTNQILFQQQDLDGVGRTLLRIGANGALDSFIGGSNKSSGQLVQAGVPLHVVLTFEPSGVSPQGEAEGTWRFFLNGVAGEFGVMSGADGVEASDGAFLFGIQKGLDGQFFKGLADELAIYDKALSEARITEHYNSLSEAPLITAFEVSDNAIAAGGVVTLNWEVVDEVTSLTLEPGIGNIPPRSGNGILGPPETTTYTITATKGGLVHRRSATVGVFQPGPYRITEILADNGGPVEDEDGDESDWIEIFNEGEIGGDLEGWFLTDDATNLTKWEFPDFVVNRTGYELVFASGKDRGGAGGEAHTSFRLSREGEYLALVEPDGVTIHHEFSPGFPPQQTGISWGTTNDGTGYFVNPTPRAANAETGASGFVEEVVVADVTRGFYSSPFEVSLTTEAGDAEIFYTTDSSEPTRSNGVLYEGPINVETTTTLRAGAFRGDEDPVNIMTHTYIFLEDVIDQPAAPAGFPATWQPSVTADYEMSVGGKIGTEAQVLEALRDLPTLSLVMDVDDWFDSSTNPAIGGIYSNSTIARGSQWERKVSAEFFDFPHGKDIQVNAGMRIFGNASRATSRKKHNMRLVFRSSYGPSILKFPLFGDDANDDEVNSYLLRGQNGDSWFHPTAGQREEALYIRDQLARQLQADMGQASTKQGHIHVYLNGLYWGVFNTIERIESDSMVQAFGGEKEEWDVIKSSPGPGIEAVDGTVNPWNEVLSISSGNMALDSNYQAIQEYLDLENMIDWLLVNFYNGNSDWDTNNWQAGRRRVEGGTFKFFTWDSERTLLGPTVNNTTKNNAGRATAVHQKLRANANYRLLFADRIHRHLFNGGALSPSGVGRSFQRFVDELRSPLIAESARWGDAQRVGNPYAVGVEWQTEVNFQTNTYIPNRTATVLDQFKTQGLYPSVEAPVFNQFGGEVGVGFGLVMSTSAEEIRYTLDGSDPMDGSGLLYEGVIPLNEPVIVKARSLSGGVWSALASAGFYVGTDRASGDNLVITELNYHPENDDNGEEFIELMNVGENVVDLRGVSFGDGVDFAFGPSPQDRLWTIAPGERIVLVGNQDDFLARYGMEGLAEFKGGLSNDGERIELRDFEGSIIHEFIYNDAGPWPRGADGSGGSLVLISPYSLPDHSDGMNWRSSLSPGGTPGTGDGLLFEGVVGLDQDGDGLDDLLEFVMGTDEQDPADGLGVIQPSASGALVGLRYPTQLGTDQFRVVVESSTNLRTWNLDETLSVVEREIPVDGIEWVELEGSPSNLRRYFRLKVEER